MPPGNRPTGDALLQRIATLEAIVGITGRGAGGLSFPSPANQQPQVFPAVSSFYAGNLTTSSGSFVTITNSPSVTTYLGASGDAIISVSCNFNVSTSGIVQLLVDGKAPGANAGEILFCLLGAPGAVSVAATVKVSNLFQQTFTPNLLHTFTLKYLSGSGSITCAQNSLTVSPI